jgi:hypothetical protein
MESWLTNVFASFDAVVQADGALFHALFGGETRSSSVKLLLCRNDPTRVLFPRECLCEVSLDADFMSSSPQQLVRLARDLVDSSTIIIHVASLISSADDIPRWASALLDCPDQSILLVPSKFASEHVSVFAFHGMFCGDSFNGWSLLQHRRYTVREANVFDLERLLFLEQAWDDPNLQAPENDILWRLSNFPEGQLVLEMESTVVAVLYSQRLSQVLSLSTNVYFSELKSLSCSNGSVLQFLAALSDQKFAQAQPAHYLLQHALHFFFCKGFRTVQAVTRWSQFGTWNSQHPEQSPRDYYGLKDVDGFSIDATVRWHQCKKLINKKFFVLTTSFFLFQCVERKLLAFCRTFVWQTYLMLGLAF